MPVFRTFGLRAIKRITAINGVPGKFVIADLAGKHLAPHGDQIMSQIGKYHVRLNMKDEIQRQVYFGLYDKPLARLLSVLLSQVRYSTTLERTSAISHSLLQTSLDQRGRFTRSNLYPKT